MNRKIIALIGYLVIALLGAAMIAVGAVTVKEQIVPSILMMLFGVVLLLIGIRGPIQFLRREKQSEERYREKNEKPLP